MLMRPVQLLIIEDNPEDIQVIQEHLRSSLPDLNLNLRLARSGAEALETLCINGYSPDLVLLDLGLPEIDGISVLRQARASGFDFEGIPIIVFSSSSTQIGDAAQAGATGYFVRPSSLLEYVRAIERFAVLFIRPKALRHEQMA